MAKPASRKTPNRACTHLSAPECNVRPHPGTGESSALMGRLPQPQEQATIPAIEPTLEQITTIAQTYRLLGDATRLRILLVCLEGPLPVNEIARRTEASQSLVSHHLRLLRAARLVKGTRQNKQVLYEAGDDHISHMLADMIEHVAEQ